MRCFEHRDQEALGICKRCGKGLCTACAVDLGHRLSCRGEHETVVEFYRTILERTSKSRARRSE